MLKPPKTVVMKTERLGFDLEERYRWLTYHRKYERGFIFIVPWLCSWYRQLWEDVDVEGEKGCKNDKGV